jgi:GT2 family glycosyltransferase
MKTEYCAVVVTFRRPEPLLRTLSSLMAQHHRPNFVVVADNDPARSAEAVIAERSWPVPVINLPMPRNLGPAGGWGAATRDAQVRPDRGEWVLVLDDDDPIQHPEVIGRLITTTVGPEVGAVGLRGAIITRPLGLLRRVSGNSQPVDYLAGNGLPLYRWEALEAVGGFDESLFFGFEDLDLGLRLRRAGWSLLATQIDDRHTVADTAPGRIPWREYYKSRALVTVAHRHLGPVVTALTAVRLGVGGMRLLFRDQGPKLLVARLRGVADGLRGHIGVRRYDPEGNPPKRASPYRQP